MSMEILRSFLRRHNWLSLSMLLLILIEVQFLLCEVFYPLTMFWSWGAFFAVVIPCSCSSSLYEFVDKFPNNLTNKQLFTEVEVASSGYLPR